MPRVAVPTAEERDPQLSRMRDEQLQAEYTRLRVIQHRAVTRGHDRLYARVSDRLDDLIGERAYRQLQRAERDKSDGRELA